MKPHRTYTSLHGSLINMAVLAAIILLPRVVLAQDENFDDTAIRSAICDLFRMSQGAFGALFALASGIGAVVAAAFGMYRAGSAFLVVSVSYFAIPAMIYLSFGTIDCAGLEDSGYNDVMLQAEICDRFQFIEGSGGALVMTIAGIIAIVSAAIGAFRAWYTLAFVGCGAFILRALLSLYFGTFDCDAIYEMKKEEIGKFFQMDEDGGDEPERETGDGGADAGTIPETSDPILFP